MRDHIVAARRVARPIQVGDVTVGGGAPIAVQSMTNTLTTDIDATVAQIQRLQDAGADIVRVSVPDPESAAAMPEILAQVSVPIIADIHFSYKMALASLEAGVHGLRLNPGNIGGRDRVERVVKAAAERGISIRIGVNAGSLEKEIEEKYGEPCADAMVESALSHVRILEVLDFQNIKISLKASNIPMTVAAYRKLATRVDYPLHLGITESGSRFGGTIKSSIGLGLLLAEGIGDTIRVSLATDPVEEVRVAYEMLKALELRSRGPVVIACPTCGRLEVDLFKIAGEIERATAHIKMPLSLAVMGCAVNGPGEAREADLGVAAGRGNGMIYREGKAIRRVSEQEIVPALLEEIERFVVEKSTGAAAESSTGEKADAAAPSPSSFPIVR